jgi:hypothetical protein
MFARKLFLVAPVCMALGLAPGCGGDPLGRQPVSGSVNLDGAPLPKGSIRFQPLEKGIGTGARVEGGKYAIARKDGLPVGKYLVLINAAATGADAQSDAPPGAPPAPPKELIPEDWNEKTEHTIEITSGKNEHNFDVQTKKK